jgi:hypothetical protein
LPTFSGTETGFEILVEELGRHGAFELVESKIQELEGGYLPTKRLLLSQLRSRSCAAQSVVHNAAETVGVEVGESEICEETELLWKVAGNISVVEVNANGHCEGGIGTRWSTVGSHVADG